MEVSRRETNASMDSLLGFLDGPDAAKMLNLHDSFNGDSLDEDVLLDIMSFDVGEFISNTDESMNDVGDSASSADTDDQESLFSGDEDFFNTPLRSEHEDTEMMSTEPCASVNTEAFGSRVQLSAHYKTSFDAQYWRNDRKNLQCFPVCPEFGNFYESRIRGGKHTKKGACIMPVLVEVSAAGSEQPIQWSNVVLIAQFAKLKPPESSGLTMAETLMAEDLKSMKQNPQYCCVSEATHLTSCEGDSAAFQLAPRNASSWHFDETLPKTTQVQGPPRFALQVDVYMSAGSSGSEGPWHWLSKAVGSGFTVSSTRKLLRLKNRLKGASAKIDQSLKQYSNMAGSAALSTQDSIAGASSDRLVNEVAAKRQKVSDGLVMSAAPQSDPQPNPQMPPYGVDARQVALNDFMLRQSRRDGGGDRAHAPVGMRGDWGIVQPAGAMVKMEVDDADGKRAGVAPAQLFRSLGATTTTAATSEGGGEQKKSEEKDADAVLAVAITEAAEANAAVRTQGGQAVEQGAGGAMLQKLLLLQANLEECYADTGEAEYADFAAQVRDYIERRQGYIDLRLREVVQQQQQQQQNEQQEHKNKHQEQRTKARADTASTKSAGRGFAVERAALSAEKAGASGGAGVGVGVAAAAAAAAAGGDDVPLALPVSDQELAGTKLPKLPPTGAPGGNLALGAGAGAGAGHPDHMTSSTSVAAPAQALSERPLFIQLLFIVCYGMVFSCGFALFSTVWLGILLPLSVGTIPLFGIGLYLLRATLLSLELLARFELWCANKICAQGGGASESRFIPSLALKPLRTAGSESAFREGGHIVSRCRAYCTSQTCRAVLYLSITKLVAVWVAFGFSIAAIILTAVMQLGVFFLPLEARTFPLRSARVQYEAIARMSKTALGVPAVPDDAGTLSENLVTRSV